MGFVMMDPIMPRRLRFNARSMLFTRFDGSSKSGYAIESNKLPPGGTVEDGFFPGFWPTFFVDSVEVFSPRGYFYTGGFRTDEVTKRFVVALGMDWEEFINQDIDSDVRDMWFEFKSGFAWDGTTRPIEYKDYDWPADVPTHEPTEGLTNPTNASIKEFHADAFDILEKGIDDDGNEIVTQNATEVSITISYGGGLKRYIGEHELGWEATGAEIINTGLNSKKIRDKILSDPWSYIANSRHKGSSKDSFPFQSYEGGDTTDIVTNILRPSDRKISTCDTSLSIKDYIAPLTKEKNLNLALFALMDDGSTWEPFLDADGDLEIFDQLISTVSTDGMSDQQKDEDWPTVPIEYDDEGTPINPDIPTELVTKLLRMDGEALEYRFTVKFKYKGIQDYVVNEMLSWYPNHYQDPTRIPVRQIWEDNFGNSPLNSTKDNFRSELITSMIDTDCKRALYRMMNLPAKDSSLYKDGYLIVDRVRAMKRKDFARLISTKLDQDYDIKKKSGLVSAIISIVIVVIAIIISYFFTPAAGMLFLRIVSTVFLQLGLITPQHAKLIGYVVMIMAVYSGNPKLITLYVVKPLAVEAGIDPLLVEAIFFDWDTFLESGGETTIDAAGNEVQKSVADQVIDGATNYVSSMSVTDVLEVANIVVSEVNKYMAKQYEEELNLLRTEVALIEEKQREIDYTKKEMQAVDPTIELEAEMEKYATPDMITELEQRFYLYNMPNTQIEVEHYAITAL